MRIPGNHFTMLQEPNLQMFAEEFKKLLFAVESDHETLPVLKSSFHLYSTELSGLTSSSAANPCIDS